MSRKRVIEALSSSSSSSNSMRCRNVKARMTSENRDQDEKNVTEKLVCESVTRIPFCFYETDSITLAKSLIGKILCRKLTDNRTVIKGRIVETEAYPGESILISTDCHNTC